MTLVRLSCAFHSYICTSSTGHGFNAISFDSIGMLDTYFIHRFIIITYRSSSIEDKSSNYGYGP